MKVCFVTTSFPAYQGDIQSPFIYQLAKHLVKRKVELTVVCPKYKKSRASQETMEGIHIDRFTYFPKKIQTLTETGRIASFKTNPWSLLQLPFFMKMMILKTNKVAKDADIIHCQWALSGIAGVIAKKIRNKPLIVSLRGEDLKALNNPLMRPLFKWVIRNADYITANNEFHIKQIKHLAKKVRVIRNGIDASIFKIRNKKQIREKLQLPEKKTLILFVGWLVKRKGIHHLLDAIPSVIKEQRNVRFLVIGEGELHDQLLHQAKENKIESYVSFLGKKPLEEVAEYMSAADLLVLPSLYEGMPNVVMEAFASGLPVIATDVCGTAELVKNKVNGLLVKAGDVQGLSRSLTTVLENKKLAGKLSKNALETIKKQRLTWEKSAELHIKLYEEVLRSR